MRSFKFIGSKEDTKKYGGIWSPSPSVKGIYGENCASFCPNDSPVSLLAEWFPKDWEEVFEEEEHL